MAALNKDIREQLADQKTQTQILIGHHATQRGSAPTNPLLDNKAQYHHGYGGYPPYGGMPYPGVHPGYDYGYGGGDPYYRGRVGYGGGYYNGGYGPGGYMGELRDPYYYPPAYRYVSPERR